MLYDRPYMRQQPEPAPRQKSMVTILLVTTIVVFVLQQVLNVFFPAIGGRPNRFLTDWFALSGPNFRELKVWTVLSYGLLHSTQSIMHVVGNMLGLYFIGRILEPLLGKQQLLLLYLAGALTGGLVYLTFHFNDAQPVIGASAAVFALVSFFCLRFPERPITLLLFFIIPITVKPKSLFKWTLVVSLFGLVCYELIGPFAITAYTEGNRSLLNKFLLSPYQIPLLPTIAHTAHLGGILVGILYFRYVFNSSSSFSARSHRPGIELPEWFKRKNTAQRHMSYRVNQTKPSDLQKEVDRILDKINGSGFGSLTENEKNTLDRAKDILKK
jgi:membrane associated rhomboid family serine protease